jgi:hypothetical protein
MDLLSLQKLAHHWIKIKFMFSFIMFSQTNISLCYNTEKQQTHERHYLGFSKIPVTTSNTKKSYYIHVCSLWPKGLLWSWLYGGWIYNYLYEIGAYQHWSCEFESCSWRDVLDTTLCDKVCQWLVAGQWLSPVSSTNKSYHHDITVALNPITLTPFWPNYKMWKYCNE